MKIYYKIALTLLVAGIGFSGGYFTHRATTSNTNLERRIGIRLEDTDRDGKIDNVYLCFDRNGDGKFDTVSLFTLGKPPVNRQYTDECDARPNKIETVY